MDPALCGARRTHNRDDLGDKRSINENRKPGTLALDERTSSAKAQSTSSNRSRSFRDRGENDGKDRISDIFNAIVKEIYSVISSHRNKEIKTAGKTLGDVLKNSDGPSKTNVQAVNFLHVLIDRKSRKNSIRKSPQRDDSDSPSREETAGNSAELRMEQIPAETSERSSSTIETVPICRICHERRGPLVMPCDCRGTQANVHVECLQRWLTEKAGNSCELCNHIYQTIHSPRINLLASMTFWYKFGASRSERESIAKDVIMLVATLAILMLWNLFVRSYCLESNSNQNLSVSRAAFNLFAKLISFFAIVWYGIGVATKTNTYLSKWFAWYTRNKVTLLLSDFKE